MTSWKAEDTSGREGRPGSGEQEFRILCWGSLVAPDKDYTPVWGSWAGCVIQDDSKKKTGSQLPLPVFTESLFDSQMERP